jgi:hypothetical protein
MYRANIRLRKSCRARQRGAVLVVGLVMLVVMTLLVVSMIRTSVVELKIGGASQIAQQNLSNAEVMINSFIDVNNGRFASNYLALPTGSGGPVRPGTGTATYNAATTVYAVPAQNLGGLILHGNADLQVRQVQCSGVRQVGIGYGAIQHVFFDVRSTATGALGGSATVHTGIRSVVPSGSC